MIYSERIKKKREELREKSNKESAFEETMELLIKQYLEPIKNGDVSGLENSFNNILYNFYGRGYIDKPVRCITDVTTGLDGLGAEKEHFELYFYVDTDEAYGEKPGYMVSGRR